eukprot:9192947-Pyramimonas_sp.AAC.2
MDTFTMQKLTGNGISFPAVGAFIMYCLTNSVSGPTAWLCWRGATATPPPTAVTTWTTAQSCPPRPRPTLRRPTRRIKRLRRRRFWWRRSGRREGEGEGREEEGGGIGGGGGGGGGEDKDKGRQVNQATGNGGCIQ